MLSLLTFAFKCMCFQVCRPVYAETNIVMIFTPMFGDVNFFINWIFSQIEPYIQICVEPTLYLYPSITLIKFTLRNALIWRKKIYGQLLEVSRHDSLHK